MNKNVNIKKLCISSFIVAIAFVFSKIQLIQLPFGGSVTLFTMLIISLPGYIFGIYYGFIVVFAFSLLKCIFAGYVINLASIIFDYFLSYVVFGITGFSYKKSIFNFTMFYVIAVFFRFVFSCISGIVFFSEYCPKGMNLFIYVVTYNGSYIFVEAILSLIIVFFPPIKDLLVKVCKEYE